MRDPGSRRIILALAGLLFLSLLGSVKAADPVMARDLFSGPSLGSISSPFPPSPPPGAPVRPVSPEAARPAFPSDLQTPRTLLPERGAHHPSTGEFHAGAFGGLIDPRTGILLPRVNGGYLHPQTGEFWRTK